jgi:hypothetical protein
MCFTLYAGTAHPIPRSEFDWNSPNVAVRSLAAPDAPVKTHFSQPEVQYIGSTSCCGCDFPHAILHNGEWLAPAEEEADRLSTHRRNMEALVALLHSSGECDVELYGIWSGDVVTAPHSIESISIEQLLDADFHFQDRGFYRVSIESNAAPHPHGRWTNKPKKKKKKSSTPGSNDAILDSLRRKRAERAAAHPDAAPAAPVQTSSPDEEDEAPPLPAPGLRLIAVNYVPVKKP